MLHTYESFDDYVVEAIGKYVTTSEVGENGTLGVGICVQAERSMVVESAALERLVVEVDFPSSARSTLVMLRSKSSARRAKKISWIISAALNSFLRPCAA